VADPYRRGSALSIEFRPSDGLRQGGLNTESGWIKRRPGILDQGDGRPGGKSEWTATSPANEQRGLAKPAQETVVPTPFRPLRAHRDLKGTSPPWAPEVDTRITCEFGWIATGVG
jgi:hypothetical protein